MKLVLSISPDYLAKRWSTWEVIREFVQNILDEQDQGKEATIRYDKKSQTLLLENEGSLGRERLLLGSTSKAGDTRTRGEFGEGLKLAIAVGLRLGMEFKIVAGSEIWIPKIEHSEEFNSETIVIHTRKIKDRGKVTVEIKPLDEKTWKEVQQRVLSMYDLPEKSYLGMYSGKILLAPKLKGKLFVKGLYVCNLDDFKYGYDLNYVELDRDRRLAESHSLNRYVRDVWKEAVTGGKATPEMVLDILKSECGESTKCFGGERLYDYGGERFYQEITEAWSKEYGEDAIPVSTMQESIQAEQHGMRGVVVPRGMRNAVEKQMGSFVSRVKQKESDVTARYGWGEMTDDEKANLLWVSQLFDRIGEKALDIVIVDFVGRKYLGTFRRKDGEDEIRVARWAVNDKDLLLKIIVHEFSHGHGTDGSVAHRDSNDSLYIRMVRSFDTEAAQHGGISLQA